MKRILTLIMVAIVGMSLGLIAAQSVPKPVPSKQKGMKLSQKQFQAIAKFHPWLNKGIKRHTPQRNAIKPLNSKKSTRVSPKANASGSTVQGWRVCPVWGDYTRGWYELGIDGNEQKLWEYHYPNWEDEGLYEEPDFPFHTGFVRNGKVYGFHSETLFYWLIWGHGCFSFDGKIEEYHEYGADLSLTDFSTYVISCAFDEPNDIVYVYTPSSDGSSYQLQTVNPETWEFSLVKANVPLEDVCVGFAYNPVDKELYGMTPDARFVILNKNDGSLDVIKKFNLPVTNTLEGMTYSPLDKLFFFVYSDGYDDSTLYTIDPKNPELNEIASLPDCIQYRILVTPDQPVDDKAPKTPVILSISFPNGTLSGSATLKLPEFSFDGMPLSGNLKLTAYVDDTETSEVYGTPGSEVEVYFSNISEGKHIFKFKTSSGDLAGSSVSYGMFIGYGTPSAPSNIELNEGKLTWDAVTESVDGGFIDVDNVTYNVFLNGNKLNDSPITICEYSFAMPDGDYSIYSARVEADNHGHLSEQGISNDILHGKPLTLPFSLHPTETEAKLITTITNYPPESQVFRTWRYHTFESDGIEQSCFLCDTYSYDENQEDENQEEWMFLPPVHIPKTDKLVELSFQFAGAVYDECPENLTVAYGSEANPDAMTLVKQWEFNPAPNSWTEMKIWFAPNEGTQYIGFLTKPSSDGNNVMVRNINLSVSERPDYTPAAVANLSAEPLPKGALKAKVSFTMPGNSVTGSQIEGNLTATVKSSVETRTVNASPGKNISVEVSTADGLNDIMVFASNEADGIESNVSVFTGNDVPLPISLEKSKVGHTEDYTGLHIEWEHPDKGANGGYVNPDDVTYALCIYNEETYEWEIAQQLGHVTSCDYFPDPKDKIDASEVGILSQNAKGNCGTLFTTYDVCGKPYTLPLWDSVDAYELRPKIAEQPDDSYDYYGFSSSYDAYPYWISSPTPYGNAAYFATGSDGYKVRTALPAFSTEGIKSAHLEASLYSTDKSAKINIFAETYGSETELLASYCAEESDGFVRKRFEIPSKFLDKKWVEIKMEAEINSEEEATVAFGPYKIQTFFADDISLFYLYSPNFMTIGRQANISATIENNGLQSAESPSLELSITKNGKEIAKIPMTREDGDGRLNELEQATYITKWTPGPDAEGELTISAKTMDADMNESNNIKSATAWVGRDNNPTVTDLEARVMEESNNAHLTWTDPTVETGFESFESLTPFSYGDQIGDFKSVILDDNELNTEFEFDIPFASVPKAWQVINIREVEKSIADANMENKWFSASTGDQCLMTTPPISIIAGAELAADRWLITPELKPQSKVSFKLTSAVTGYVEPVEILVSSTDDNPENFTSIETLRLLSSGWKEYEYTLPSDARYLAIRYLGNSDGSQFLLLDDFSYVPAAESPKLIGYDIYRDGRLLNESLAVRSTWADTQTPASDMVYYNIKPVVSKQGVVIRGLMSNTAYVQLSGVNNVETAKARILAADGSVMVIGFAGERIIVSDSQGRVVADVAKAPDAVRIPVEPGIYAVRAGSVNAKLMVR